MTLSFPLPFDRYGPAFLDAAIERSAADARRAIAAILDAPRHAESTFESTFGKGSVFRLVLPEEDR